MHNYSKLQSSLFMYGICDSNFFLNLRFRDADDSSNKEEKHFKLSKRNPTNLWQPFHTKQRKSYQRSHSDELLSKHPSLSSKMRTILLDWLIEVCEVYRLHRETFYLAADFFDRYMSKTDNVPKTKLQLIGNFYIDLKKYYRFNLSFYL